MTALILHHAAILRPGAQVHITRSVLTSERPKALHDHDFYELIWVQNGELRHHTTAGKETLKEGDLVFLRPGQRHGLQGRGEMALCVALCLHPDLMAGLLARHPALDGQLFWSPTEVPVTVRRDIRQMAALNQAALALEASRCDALAAEAFLTPVLSELSREMSLTPVSAPDWLRRACHAAQTPEVFRDGAAGLVAQTGLAHSHVSRTMRKVMGQSPSEYINAVRMSYAGRTLLTDSALLPEIASDCGIPNLSHFHRLFKAFHGMTPLQFRQKFQRDVMQPKP